MPLMRKTQQFFTVIDSTLKQLFNFSKEKSTMFSTYVLIRQDSFFAT